jgi:hypothetical protein
MIFINASGYGKTDTETILDIIGCLDFYHIKKCKTRNKQDFLQVLILDADEKALCFVNFMNGNKRIDFIKALNEQYPLIEVKEEDFQHDPSHE